jgi:hypothetical protein
MRYVLASVPGPGPPRPPIPDRDSYGARFRPGRGPTADFPTSAISTNQALISALIAGMTSDQPEETDSSGRSRSDGLSESFKDPRASWRLSVGS